MQTFDDWINERLNKLHMIKLAQLMPEAAASQIFDKLPEGEIFQQDQLILYIEENVGIDDPNLIQEALQILADQQRLIVVEKNGITFYRKMQL